MRSALHPRNHRRKAVGLAVVAALAVAACGGDDDDAAPEPATDETAADAADDADEPADTTADESPDDTAAADDDGTETTDSAETDEPAGDVEPTGDLVVGYVGTVDGMNPFPQGTTTLYHRVALYDPFVQIDDAGEPVAMLAESWDFPDDGMSLTLHLREGVTFHDGTPFDADVAVANIEMFKDPATNVQGGGVWAAVTAEAVDASTVELTFDRPLPEIFAVMGTALITKPGEIDSGIGTGPFVLEEFNAREGLTMTANPDYWDASRPKVATVELREFADPAAAALAAQAGDLDILLSPQPNQVGELEGAGLTIIEEPAGAGYDILVNAELVPDPLVRRALSMAFDRERFVETIMLGYGSPMSSIYPPSSPVHFDNPADVTAFDLDGARALLDEAGVESLDLTIMSPPVLPLDQFMPLYQQDLATIGINLTIEPVDPATWGQAVSQPGSIPDLSTHAYGFADLDPALIFSAHPFRIGSNASGFVDPEYEELYTEASAIVETDARYAAFLEIDDYIGQQAFMFPVANPTGLTATAAGVEGYDGLRAGFDYSNVTVSE